MNPELRRVTAAAGFACALLLVSPGSRAGAVEGGDEDFHYHWRLGNVVGVVLSLFLPHQGDGELAFKMQKDGHLRGELMITSPDSKTGEFWRYGSEIDPHTLQPIRVWSSFFWRGRSKSTKDEIEQKGVFDISCAIYALRHEPFQKPRDMEIWSDGKIYPVTVVPMGEEIRTVSNQRVGTRHFAIRGRDLPDRRKWTANVDFWLAKDPAATPVQIQISRRLADVTLDLLPPPSPG
ncbi:MAG TPA: DUF3108 domain-containing protein [Thermoanaerobaculia bacterium]|jgi:hypothetical protein|nr:DUF3108 domain-containing protein [Thermoanaerobaculia bacterium]